jgi:hypothetical protein
MTAMTAASVSTGVTARTVGANAAFFFYDYYCMTRTKIFRKGIIKEDSTNFG